MKRDELLVELVRKRIENTKNSEDISLKKGAFTRNRKLGFERIIHMLLRGIFSSLQLTIDRYFEEIDSIPVTKQAFSKARQLLNPEYVREFADDSATVFARSDDMPEFWGMRIVAIDGTTLALENTPELKKYFGTSGSKKDSATALASIAYDPLGNGIYDCQIAPYKTDERDLAKRHMERLEELGLQNSLLLFDRWYPSKSFIYHTLTRGFSFIMRVRQKWNLEVDAIQEEGSVTLTYDDATFPVRVIKVVLPTGEIETLLTNLTETQLPRGEAGALYFKRWGVEIAYDLLKSKLQLENFSGKTVVSVLQDFYSTIWLANFTTACMKSADEKIKENDKTKNLKYERKSSKNRTIEKLRADFYTIILEPDEGNRERLLRKLTVKIARFPEQIRPDRSHTRNLPRNKRFHMAKKIGVA